MSPPYEFVKVFRLKKKHEAEVEGNIRTGPGTGPQLALATNTTISQQRMGSWFYGWLRSPLSPLPRPALNM